MNQQYFTDIKSSWQIWKERSFRIRLVISFIAVAIILTILPFFFQFIEKRHGVSFNDFILINIKPSDVSVPVFFIIWTCAILMVIRLFKVADIVPGFLASYALMTLLRFATIYWLPLEPPIGLIALKDPLSNSFYGDVFITKDLFFSGHTSTLFLIFLFQDKLWKKVYCLFGVILIAVLLLIQHVHYTIDVIFAFPFAYISYMIGKKY